MLSNSDPSSNTTHFPIMLFQLQKIEAVHSSYIMAKHLELYILVPHPLVGNNYLTWARAMKMAMDSKSKLGFIDGSIIAAMPVTPLKKQAWLKCNSMISSWILNLVSSQISTSVIYRDTTFEVQNVLENHFSQANGPRILQLQKQISRIMQGDSTVTNYFRNL